MRDLHLVAALKAEGFEVPSGDIDASVLTHETERELIKRLLLPEEIKLAARDYDPSRLSWYVVELAARFLG